MSVTEVIMRYRTELEEIKSEDIRTFVSNALQKASHAFQSNEKQHAYIKRVIRLLNALMEQEGTTGAYRDMIIASVLLCDITKYDLPADLQYLHPLTVRTFLDDYKQDLHHQLFDALMTLIETHEGIELPVKGVRPQQGTPGYIVALAHQICKMDFIQFA